MAFEARHADDVAELLAEQFPDPEAWRKAKRQRFASSLGLTKEQADTAPGKQCAATVDWWIAGQAMKQGWILVTGDKGPEFRGLDDKIELAALEAILGELHAARAPS